MDHISPDKLGVSEMQVQITCSRTSYQSCSLILLCVSFAPRTSSILLPLVQAMNRADEVLADLLRSNSVGPLAPTPKEVRDLVDLPDYSEPPVGLPLGCPLICLLTVVARIEHCQRLMLWFGFSYWSCRTSKPALQMRQLTLRIARHSWHKYTNGCVGQSQL